MGISVYAMDTVMMAAKARLLVLKHCDGGKSVEVRLKGNLWCRVTLSKLGFPSAIGTFRVLPITDLLHFRRAKPHVTADYVVEPDGSYRVTKVYGVAEATEALRHAGLL